MDILYDKPPGIKIVGAILGTKADAAKQGQTLSEDVGDDPEIQDIISAITRSLEAAKSANTRHQSVVLAIKELEESKNGIKKELVKAQQEILVLKSKDSATSEELNRAKEELVQCNGKLEESNKKLEKLKELEDLVDKQKKEIEILSKLAEKTAKTAKSRRLVSEDKIEKLENEAYKLEVKHKKEFDAKVEELDDLRAKFKGLEISLKKQEAETSKRETERNEYNAGLIKAKKKVKTQKVEISSLQSKIKIRDKEIQDEAKEVKKSEDDLRKAKAAVGDALGKVSKAEQEAAIAEKKRLLMEEKYQSAKKAMKKMQEDGTAACINPEPKNQPILAGKAKEKTEYLGYWVKGMGEALYHPHDFKKISGEWKDTTSQEKLELFARFEGRWNGIRRGLLLKMKAGPALQKKASNIFDGSEDIIQEQSRLAQAGRNAKTGGVETPYISGGDTMWNTLYGKTITFKTKGELKKLYDELTKSGAEEAKNNVKPQGQRLLNNIQLKF